MNPSVARDIRRYSAARGNTSARRDADPVTTEIIRNALNSIAAQMMRVMTRTAFSPVIVESKDFAIAIYDAQIRLMAQANTLPVFIGTMGFCVEYAVESVGGAGALEPGDIIVYNVPYGTGSHAQDAALVLPVFLDGALQGYICNKAHWMDIGAKDPYCTDTIDVFQEGLVLPGLKLYRRGERVVDLLRVILANSRTPRELEGDLNAQVASARVGEQLFAELVRRYGPAVFWASVESMYDHGEAFMRRFLEQIPDGRYSGTGYLDDDGLDDRPIEFSIGVEVAGSSVRFDFSQTPDAQAGPMNCPLPSTVSGCRLAMAALAKAHYPPNEGFFRPIEIVTRRGSMFHPVSPQPCFLYGWPLESALEAINEAFCQAADGIAPAGGAGDIVGVEVWGYSKKGYMEGWNVGTALPVGQGGHATGDGAILQVASMAFSRIIPMEVDEARAPVLFERMEIIPDSCGAGRHRGSVGWSRQYRTLADSVMISTIERTRVAPKGQRGGLDGAANRLVVIAPDGARRVVGKVTRYPVPAGSHILCEAGGGGGYGPPGERDPVRVRRDLLEGYVTPAYVQRHHPRALGCAIPPGTDTTP